MIFTNDYLFLCRHKSTSNIPTKSHLLYHAIFGGQKNILNFHKVENIEPQSDYLPGLECANICFHNILYYCKIILGTNQIVFVSFRWLTLSLQIIMASVSLSSHTREVLNP